MLVYFFYVMALGPGFYTPLFADVFCGIVLRVVSVRTRAQLPFHHCDCGRAMRPREHL